MGSFWHFHHYLWFRPHLTTRALMSWKKRHKQSKCQWQGKAFWEIENVAIHCLPREHNRLPWIPFQKHLEICHEFCLLCRCDVFLRCFVSYFFRYSVFFLHQNALYLTSVVGLTPLLWKSCGLIIQSWLVGSPRVEIYYPLFGTLVHHIIGIIFEN